MESDHKEQHRRGCIVKSDPMKGVGGPFYVCDTSHRLPYAEESIECRRSALSDIFTMDENVLNAISKEEDNTTVVGNVFENESLQPILSVNIVTEMG